MLLMATAKQPNLLSIVKAKPWSDQVRHWGSARPWGKRGSNEGHIHIRHKGIEFSADDVTMDSDGNTIAIPPHDKPCLGQVCFLRHGSKKQTRRDQNGRDVETTNHRCGNCLVRDACRKIIMTKIQARPKAKQKFVLWRAEAVRVLGSKAKFEEVFGRNHTIYTGAVPGSRCGYLWRDFLEALAEDGPFTDRNDAVLQQMEEEKQRKLRSRRRKNKQAERDRKQALKQPPDRQFLNDLAQERDSRERLLVDAIGYCGDASVSNLDDRGCSITADTWYEKMFLEEAGERPTAGKIAKRLLARGAVDGVSEGALRQRIHKTDLKRIEFLESDRSGPIWPAFDPLASAEMDDFYDLAA
jgi:hypothetical protein